MSGQGESGVLATSGDLTPDPVVFRTTATADLVVVKKTELTDSGEKSGVVEELEVKKFLKLSAQQDELIGAMKRVFAWLNGAIIAVIVVGLWMDQANLYGNVIAFKPADRLITSNIVSALIAATVAQAGLAFLLIVKYLFPQQANDKNNNS